jgi:hypothetical protein
MFLHNYSKAKALYEAEDIVSPIRFVGLQSFGNLETGSLKSALENQLAVFKSVELMCHPGYPDG